MWKWSGLERILPSSFWHFKLLSMFNVHIFKWQAAYSIVSISAPVLWSLVSLFIVFSIHSNSVLWNFKAQFSSSFISSDIFFSFTSVQISSYTHFLHLSRKVNTQYKTLTICLTQYITYIQTMCVGWKIFALCEKFFWTVFIRFGIRFGFTGARTQIFKDNQIFTAENEILLYLWEK